MKVIDTFNAVVGQTKLDVKQHSPEILLVVGTLGLVAGGVMACIATKKADEVVAPIKEEIDILKAEHEDGFFEVEDETLDPEKEYKKQLTHLYFNYGMAYAKLYGPAVLVSVCSIGTLFASNDILRKRNAELGAAYMSVDSAFKRYRAHVVEELGEEQDFRFRHGIKTQEVTVTETDPETGKEKKVKKKIDVVTDDPTTYSDYSRFFDSASREWEDDAEANLFTLKAKQNWANDVLKSRGHLFLNEVYDMLDIPRSKAGQTVGWVYDLENPVGDNYVDFGIYEISRERNRAFVNGEEDVILLDFNVDGPILELLR